MSGFSADWLDLREAVDHASRAHDLTIRASQRLARLVDQTGTVRVVDLACGTGSNPRYLVPRLGVSQEWTGLDADQALLAAWPVRTAAWASTCGMACTETADGLVVSASAFEARLYPRRSDISRFPISGFAGKPNLVTASALLDLVSEAWLASCVGACAELGASALFALSYDGRTTLTPSHADDAVVVELVNAHQRGDKGFGPALGPDATDCAARLFGEVGYEVHRAQSDWHLAPDAWRLQRDLIAGWAHAAAEVSPVEHARFRAWTDDRIAACEARRLTIVVGHEDIAAWPSAVGATAPA